MSHLTLKFLRQQELKLRHLHRELSGQTSLAADEVDRSQVVELGDAAQLDELNHLKSSLAELGHRGMADVEAALAKLKRGTYGICEMTGEPIPAARLEAVPHARLSLQAQRKMEERRPGQLAMRRSYGVERDPT